MTGLSNGSTQGEQRLVEISRGDARYGGAKAVIDRELEEVIQRRRAYARGPDDAPGEVEEVRKNLVGLALSGGGIRSATFCLGVMQALAGHDWMRRVDYLSTVSGGGYIGSSLSWFLSRKGFGLEGGDTPAFPFGTRNRELDNLRPTRQEAPGEPEVRAEASPRGILRWLRQNGKYLAPGGGITWASFVAVCLRCILLSVLVYFPLLVLALFVLQAAGFFETAWGLDAERFADVSRLIVVAGGLGILLVVAAILYSLFTRFVGILEASGYKLRHGLEKWSGRVLILAVATLVLGSLRPLSIWLDELGAPAKPALVLELTHDAGSGEAAALGGNVVRIHDARLGDLAVSGRLVLAPDADGGIPAPPADGDNQAGEQPGKLSTVIGLISSLLGALSAIGVFRRGGEMGKGRVSTTLVASVGSMLLVYGLLLCAYDTALVLSKHTYWLWLPVVLVGLVGWVTNLNLVSIHRYYRDRLMETFMPDVPLPRPRGGHRHDEPQSDDSEGTETEHPLGRLATGANVARLTEFLKLKGKAPYHLINTNVVLVDSQQAKYRGRGGDSFLLSPCFCGGNATGWQPTEDYMDNLMNLPAAMAISGAAANPHTGVGGEGITRNYAISFLMAFLNIRLGYWAPNPNENAGSRWLRLLRWLSDDRPNFLFPGLWELFAAKGLNEQSPYVELTDGGHFENLGIYELVRRRCKLIIACDGGADPDFDFADLANAIEKVRVDFGAKIALDVKGLQPLVPVDRRESSRQDEEGNRCDFASRGYVVAPIEYPRWVKDGPQETGWLIYIKTTFTDRQSGDIYGYRLANPAFPDQTTADQFFDEKQFEAYRELGFQIVHEMLQAEPLPDGEPSPHPVRDNPALRELGLVAGRQQRDG